MNLSIYPRLLLALSLLPLLGLMDFAALSPRGTPIIEGSRPRKIPNSAATFRFEDGELEIPASAKQLLLTVSGTHSNGMLFVEVRVANQTRSDLRIPPLDRYNIWFDFVCEKSLAKIGPKTVRIKLFRSGSYPLKRSWAAADLFRLPAGNFTGINLMGKLLNPWPKTPVYCRAEIWEFIDTDAGSVPSEFRLVSNWTRID